MTWAPDYVSVSELTAYVRIPEGDTLDDAQVQFAITAASRAIDKATRRQFGSEPGVRYYTPEYDKASGRYMVRIDDLMSVGGEGFAVAVDADSDGTYSTNVTVSQFTKIPLNAEPNGRPWERFVFAASVTPPLDEGSVRITADWGWDAVPAAIKQACLIQAMRFLKRREAWAGVVGSPEMGIGETRLLDTLDADVAVAVRPYRLVVMG